MLGTLRQRCLVGQAMALVLWNAPAFAQNIITPDGRTQTNVAVSGTTTTITTQTVSGGAGYNSFSRFEQSAGTTVNLHLPQNTGALVNIVRDGPVVVNGILNSYKNGSIGGHVYFSDSAGFTVGPSGVINTGRLTVNTPTREFLDQVIAPNGTVNETMAARLRANDVPISPDGTITIDGRINARRGVTLHGNSVSVAGQITANAAPVDIGEQRRRHQTAFSQSVNTNGLRHGAAMVARRGGGIEIVAAGTTRISGSLSANATARRSAGSIVVRSGKGTTITETARLSATGAAPSAKLASTAPGAAAPAVNTGDGGKISLTSDAAISIAGGARFDASAAQTVAGRGGEIKVLAGTNLDVAAGATFAGKGGLTGDGGFLELSAKKTVTIDAIDVNLATTSGKNGVFLIDPQDLVINSANISVNGADVNLTADNSITIAAGGSVDTRQFTRANGDLSATNASTGNSGAITLTAPKITVLGSLRADVVNAAGSNWVGGDITLTSTASTTQNSGNAHAEAIILVNGTVSGKDVKFIADATGISSFINPSANMAQFIGLTAQALLTGLNGGYVASTIESRVTIQGNATVKASGNLTVTADGKQEASLPAIALTGISPVAAAITLAEIKGTITTEIESGANVTVGGNLTLASYNNATMAATAIAVSGGQTRFDAAIAVGTADIATKAIVNSGATVTVASGSVVKVSAINKNSFSTGATAVAASGGVAGIAFAYSDVKSSTEARLGTSIGSSTSRAGSLLIESQNNTEKNATSSSVTVGTNFILDKLGIAGAIDGLFGSLTSGGSALGKFGSSFTYAQSDLSANASIAANPGATTAPTIYAGDVAVVSKVRDFAVRINADSSLNSESKNPTAANPSATIAVSAGVLYGDFKHTSNASIGAGVTVDATHIGVAATTDMPISNTWTDWAGLGETLSHINGSFGIVSNILTSYANATSDSTELGLAGSVNYYRVNNDTAAYVGPGATLRQSGTLGDWTTGFTTGDNRTWSNGVSVVADTVTHSIDMAGNFGLFSLTGTSGGGGSAVGGSLADVGRSSTTIAAIGEGVTISADDVAVKATTSDKMFVIAPTSGKAAGAVAANGIVSLVGIDNHTYASISNTAIITASSVAVTAEQYVSLFSLTGAVAYSGSNGIGVSVAVLDPAAVTRAYVGDNSDDLSDGRLGSGHARGSISTGTIDVSATTWGRLTVASVAAAISDPNASKLNFAKGIAGAVQGESAAQAAAGKGISLSAAGSAAVATTTLGTSAWIDGAVLTAKSGGGLTPTVTALNSTIMEVAAGSAALNLAGNSSPLSGALAGAVAIGMFDNSTDARITNSSLTDAYDTKVLAVSGGRATVVGVSIAAARPNSGAAAVSAAIGIVTNRVSASVIDSTIRAVDSMAVQKSFWVGAYQTTDIGIGGGAAYAGAQAGLSAALSYTSITDPTGQDAVSAVISGSDIRNYNDPFRVTAQNSSRIASGAASGGAGPDSTGFAGAFVINEIDPTTRAQIVRGSGAIPEIRLTDDLVVLADGSRNSDLDAIIAGRTAASDIGQIDFSGSVTNDAGASNPVGASIVAVAGAVQVGKNNAGLSLLSNRIAQSHIATIDGVNVTTNGLITVKAQDNSVITGVAVGLGVATGQFAGVASTVLQSIDNVVTARISGVGGRVGGGGIVIDASATSAIRGSAGSLGIGVGAAALGLSIVDASIANQVSAQVEDVRLRAENDIVVKAASQATISTIAIGVAISRNVGLAGSVANNTVETNVAATIARADVLALDDVALLATNSDAITVSAGALGVTVLAPSVAGGLSIVNNTIGGSTLAAISDNSSVDAYASTAGSGFAYNAGKLSGSFDLTTANGPSAAQPSLAMTAKTNHGLTVAATSQQRILANAVTGGVAIFPASAAVAVVPIRNVLGGATTASIDGSLIDTRLNPQASNIAVNAASHSYAATFITVGSVGGVAAAGADAKTVMNRTTQAKLTNSTTGTTIPGFTGAGVGTVDVSAAASQSASGTVIGFAVGIGGGAAAGIVNSFDAVTTAGIDQGLVTAGSASVTADSRNGFYARAAVGVGAAVALGGAFVVADSHNVTLATVGGGSATTSFLLNGGLGILANSDNDFTGLAAGGVAGGGVGIAGMVVFIDVENETRAGLYGANVTHRAGATQMVNGASVPAGVSVTATETSTITPKAGAGAASGGFGFGSSTNIANLDSRVLAEVSGLVLSSTGALSVQATSKRVVDAMTTTVGIGSSAGLGASVGVISVGTSAPSGAQNEINSSGNGTLSRVNQLTSGSTDLVLSTSGLTAYRSYRGAAANSLSETELRDAAETEFNTLLGNGTVVNGVYTLSSAGITALRASAATALGVTTPTDAEVQSYASGRYTALSNGRVGYLLSDGGVNVYRAQVATSSVPNPTDDQVRSAADAAYQALIGRGNVTGGVFVLDVSYLDTYRAAAFAAIPLVSRGSATTASDQQVRDYAANQYSFFVSHRSRITTPQAVSATALLDNPNSQTGASITGGTIASGSVSVTSLSTTSTTNMATGLGVGGVGVGAATAYTTIGDAVSAKLEQATVTTGSITVSATSADGTDSQGTTKSAAFIKSSAGAGSGAAAAGAAVADGGVTNTITARLGGTLTVTGASSVTATNTATSRSDAVGAAAAGGLALGISLAKSAADSTVTANYVAGSQLTGGSLSVSATSTGAAYASAIAGAGGLLIAGVGADARASDTSHVEASIGAGARANVGAGAISVSATASPDAKAASLGVAVAGGLGVGASIARATAAPTVLAAIYGNSSLPTSQFTTDSLSVTATGSIFGTAATDITGRPDLTDSFARGGSSAASWATAGSGSIYYSAVGTDSRASNTSSVTASVGNYVRLPTGIVSVTASNTTVQRARGVGVTAGGVAALGTVNAQAGATTTTSATIGDGVYMAGTGSGSFTLKATGSDTEIAKVVSGSGGTFAGSGATASTSNTATTQATVGSSVGIGTNLITIAAKHSDLYGATIDSGQAAAVGASASIAKHNANSDVLVQIGDNAVFIALGSGTASCYVTTCTQGIGIESRNIFKQLELGDTITAGAGGGINGVGAKSTIDIGGTSKVLIGDTANFTSGTSAVSAPGPIAIQAITELTADDVVSLTTGGLLQGAGVTSQYRATNVDNEVTLGSNDTLTSAGTINIGTYTKATVKTSALVTTYGLAAVGSAEADTDIITRQNITIGTNSTLTGLDNVNVTAGRDASGLAMTEIYGDATAIGYVRGLIAIPHADAATDLKNLAKLTVNTGAALLSAQNVTLGAYDGTVTPNADGAGHGFQLFLIPVTQRDESPNAMSSSTVEMNGRAVGGVFHEQEIIIGCGTGGMSICGLNERPTVNVKAGGAPVTVSFNEFFNATQYVRDSYTTYTGTLPDTTVADTLVGGIAPGAVWAYRISQLYAAGGNVFINGSNVGGSGSLTAYGGPKITVVNNSAAYLILDGGAYIPDLATGQVVGAAGSSLARSPSTASSTASIVINNAYTRADIGLYGPALLIADDIRNVGGLVSINNTQGSFGFSGNRIDALQFNVTVPNGAVAVASNGPNGMYNAGASPQAEWANAILYPGGDPRQPQNISLSDIINFAASGIYSSSLVYDTTTLNRNLYGVIYDGPNRRYSTIFYGNCIGYGASGNNCDANRHPELTYYFGQGISFNPLTYKPLYYERPASSAQGGGTQIYGAQVAIKANVININASIEAGRVTNQSVYLDENLYQSIAFAAFNYNYYGYGSPTIDLTNDTRIANYGSAANTYRVVNSGDKLIPVTYDIRTGQLTISDVNASSGGGSVLLDGQIISTKALSSIKINGGFGKVEIVNNSGMELITGRINTGTAAGAAAAVSKITIVDRLIAAGPNTAVYVYTPGGDTVRYNTTDGAQPILSGANASTPAQVFSGSTSAYYDPVIGTRYDWTMQLAIHRDGVNGANENNVGTWRLNSGSNGNNPWVYVPSPITTQNSSGGQVDYWYSNTSGSETGRITNDPNATGIAFRENVYGGVSSVNNAQQYYTDCSMYGGNNNCSRGFYGLPGETSTFWNYNFVTDAWININMSVKADNRIGISFAGNAAGTVRIDSNASIRQQGNIVNPSGETKISAFAGSFTQAPNVSILSNHLTIIGRNSVGTADAPIQATLTAGAAIAAYSGAGGIYLNVDSDARVWRLNADLDAASGRYGNVNVHATGTMEKFAGVPADYINVIGNNITLRSDTGAIGGISAPLRMQAFSTLQPDNTRTGGVVNLSARGDIGVQQLSQAGDLRVGLISSTTGDVRIDVAGGRLVSATGQTAAQALTADQIAAVSRRLKLTAADGADAAAQASVAKFETQVTQTYGLYTALIGNGSVTGGRFVLSAGAIPLYQAFADAELGHAASTQEVLDYAARRYDAYASVFSTAYGASWSALARFNPAAPQANYSFSATASDAASGLVTRIAGDAVWTDRQLVSAINVSALQPGNASVGNGTALVVGRDVTLNIAGNIGSLAPDAAVSLASIRDGTISDANLAVLASASTPGSVKIVGQTAAGARVEVADLNSVAAGVTLTNVEIKQTAPLFISATGTFSGSAQGDIYLQSTSTGQSGGNNLKLGQVTATGTVNLQAVGAVTVATASNGTTPLSATQIQAGGDLVLVAGGGSIGSSATPVTFQIGGRLVSASATGDAYLASTTGSLAVGRVSATGTASLSALTGSIQSYLPGIAVAASTILLNASGNIGSATTPFTVQGGATGEVSGQAGGLVNLAAVTTSGQTSGTLRIGALTAGTTMTLAAETELRILRSLTATTGALNATGGSLAFTAGATAQAGTQATLASQSTLSLGRVTALTGITATATSTITGNGDAVVNLTASQAGGTIALNAGSGIGTTQTPVRYAASNLSAHSLQGAVNLGTQAASRVTSLLADAGGATITGQAALTIDTLQTAGTASASSTAGTLTIGTLNAAGATTLSASGLLDVTSATTTAGDLSLSSTSGGINATTLRSAARATLTASGAISVASLTSTDAASVTSSTGTLGLTSLSAGATSTLSASGAVTLGSATTTTGDLSVTSTSAGITATTIGTAGAATLTAAGPISVVTSLISGGAANATTTAGTLGITTFRAGANSTLSASGAVTLGGATTTAGDLSVTSTGGGITAATIGTAGAATLTAATNVSVTTSLAAGGAVSVTATTGRIDIAGLSGGGSLSLSSFGALALGAVATSAGDVSLTSTGASVAATSVSAPGSVTMTAATTVSVTTTSTSGGRTAATANGGTLGIGSLSAGATSTLSASGAVTLGSATTTTGDLSITSTGAGISATTIGTAGAATLTAAGPISVTTSLIAGGAASVTTTAGTLGIATLGAGATSTLSASGAVTLGSATTAAGDLSVASTGAGITAATIATAGAATLTGAGPISITTSLTSGGATRATTTAGTLGIAALNAGATSTLAASGAVTLGSATTTAGDLSVTSTGSGISATTVAAAGAATLTAATGIDVTTLTAGNGATLQAGGAVHIDSATAQTGDFAITTAGTIDARALRSSAATRGTAIGTITIGTIDAGASLTLSSSGASVSVTTANAATSATIEARTLLTLGNLATVSGNVSLISHNGAIQATQIAAGGDAALTAAGPLTLGEIGAVAIAARSVADAVTITTLAARAGATLDSATTMSLGRVTVANDLVATSAAGLSATSLSASGAARLSAVTGMTVDSLTTGRAAAIAVSAGALTIRETTSGGDTSLAASGLIRVTTLTSGATTAVSSGAGDVAITALRGTGDVTLAGDGSVRLGDLTATRGGLTATASRGAIAADTITVSGDASLKAATTVTVTTLKSGGSATVDGAQGLSLTTLEAGDSTSLTSAGAITLGNATTLRGAMLVRSTGDLVSAKRLEAATTLRVEADRALGIDTGTSGAAATLISAKNGITLTTLTVGGDAELKAATTVTVTTLKSGGSATVDGVQGLSLTTLEAGNGASLTSAGAITLGNATTLRGAILVRSTGDLVSAKRLDAATTLRVEADQALGIDTATSGAAATLISAKNGITLTTLTAGGDAGLEAATSVGVTTLTSSGATRISGDSIALKTLTAGRDITLNSRGATVLGSALTRSGGIAIVSEFGAIRADGIDGSGAVMVQAAGEVGLSTVRSGARADLSSLFATLTVDNLTTTGDASLSSRDALVLNQAGVGRDLTLRSAQDIRIDTAKTGRDIDASARTIRFTLIDAGRKAGLSADGDITGARIIAGDALTAQAGRSGLGSIGIDLGAARTASFTVPDDIRLGRFGAGDSITILGTTIAANIVQLPSGAGLPLQLDFSSSRERTAKSVTASIDAPSFRIGRFETIDGNVTTTSNLFRIAEAFVPGALTLKTPIMTVFANNRSIAPVTGYDVQLYQKDRAFFVGVDGARLTTDAFIVGFDADIADIPPSAGGSLVRDMARLGIVLPTGLSFSDIARGFVLGSDGRWRSADPETTASIGGRGSAEPLVNLDGAEGRP